MSDIIDNMREHWDSLDLESSMEVPEWKATIYKKPMNLEQKGRLYKKMEEDSISGLAYVLIELALDAQGKNHFTLDNKQFLMKKTDPDLLSGVATWLMKTPSVKDVKKK